MADKVAPVTKSFLREARLKAGFATREAASMALNYAPETIGRHERGDVAVSPDDVLRYSEVYHRPDILLRYCAECPIGKVTGRTAVDRDLPWAALRVSQRLQQAKEIADKLESIADDGIVDNLERKDFDLALEYLRSLEQTISDMLLWADKENAAPLARERQNTKKNNTMASIARQPRAVKEGADYE